MIYASRFTRASADAAAAGYRTRTYGPKLIVSTDPTVSPLQSGTNWQPFNFFGTSWTTYGVTTNSDGSINIPTNTINNYGAQICSAAYVSSPSPYMQGTAFGGGGYFEATMAFAINTTTGGPAFWANDVESMGGGSASDLTLRHWPGQGANYGDWIEVDMQEFDAGLASNQYGFSLHNWYNDGSVAVSSVGSGSPVTVHSGTDFTKPHKYGFLWVPATTTAQGYCKWYFDGAQIGNTMTWNKYDSSLPPPPIDNGTGGASAYSVLDVRHLALILGNGTAVSGQNPGPVTVYSVNVWQASSANNIVVT